MCYSCIFVQLCQGRTSSWPAPGKPIYSHIAVRVFALFTKPVFFSVINISYFFLKTSMCLLSLLMLSTHPAHCFFSEELLQILMILSKHLQMHWEGLGLSTTLVYKYMLNLLILTCFLCLCTRLFFLEFCCDECKDIFLCCTNLVLFDYCQLILS